MSTPTLWTIWCEENDYPGLWHQWFKHQCVALGYPPAWVRAGGRKSWRKRIEMLDQIKSGDVIVVALPGRRIGRLGEVISKEIDQWKPLVPKSQDDPDGYSGRRILVRWDLVHSPDNPDLVAQLPEGFTMGRNALSHVTFKPIRWFQEVMADPANWVGLVGRFGYESALSDYIALYPHRLEDGLRPHPNKKIHDRLLRVREKRFKDRSRLDVLLLDKAEKPVIVESKQESPDVAGIKQLRHYIKCLKKETGKDARGILVHGGARKLDSAVHREAFSKFPRVEIMQYRLDVDFAPSR